MAPDDIESTSRLASDIARWRLPELATVEVLAAWLGVSTRDLEWFADLGGMARRLESSPLCHYHYRSFQKASGRDRLIEIPKERLKAIQRQILRSLLDLVQPHPSAHGFCKKRSIQTFAMPHVGRPMVLRLDLQDFFPSITQARIQAVFRTLGYSQPVAKYLAGLCTNIAPIGDAIYRIPHLPQGAPTSPALANICAYRLDCRLSGLALKAGLAYTRYADDIAFSGDSISTGFAERVTAIATDEGFAVHQAKTHLMKQGGPQRLVGLVVNRVCNVAGRDFDRLKATLHNCASLGPEGQNRDGHPNFQEHLSGRVGFVETINPAKGARLRALLTTIKW